MNADARRAYVVSIAMSPIHVPVLSVSTVGLVKQFANQRYLTLYAIVDLDIVGQIALQKFPLEQRNLRVH
jgi:hypothetical protein